MFDFPKCAAPAAGVQRSSAQGSANTSPSRDAGTQPGRCFGVQTNDPSQGLRVQMSARQRSAVHPFDTQHHSNVWGQTHGSLTEKCSLGNVITH